MPPDVTMATSARETSNAPWRAVPGIVLAAACSLAFGGSIEGSSHDFSLNSSSRGPSCHVCHVPVVSTGETHTPQWARPLANPTYRVYASPSLHATVGQPGATSRLCLSCHDGALALDSFGPASHPHLSSAIRNRGGSLGKDHPIGFVFSSDLARRDGSLWDPSERLVTIGGGDRQRTGSIDSVMLSRGRMECSTCHDVHNRFTVSSTSSRRGHALLRMSLSGSSLCLACHRK